MVSKRRVFSEVCFCSSWLATNAEMYVMPLFSVLGMSENFQLFIKQLKVTYTYLKCCLESRALRAFQKPGLKRSRKLNFDLGKGFSVEGVNWGKDKIIVNRTGHEWQRAIHWINASFVIGHVLQGWEQGWYLEKARNVLLRSRAVPSAY